MPVRASPAKTAPSVTDEDLDSLAAVAGDVSIGDMMDQVKLLTTRHAEKRPPSSSPPTTRSRQQKKQKDAEQQSDPSEPLYETPGAPDHLMTDRRRQEMPPPKRPASRGKTSLADIVSPRVTTPLPGAPVVATEIVGEVDALSVKSSQFEDRIDDLENSNSALQENINILQKDYATLLREFTYLKKEMTTMALTINKRDETVSKEANTAAQRGSSSIPTTALQGKRQNTLSGQPTEKAPQRGDTPMPDAPVGGGAAWKRKKIA